VNAAGLPIAATLTPGETHDFKTYDDLMALRDSDPGIKLADKGYDSDALRQDLRDRGAAPEIPTKSNRKIQHSVEKSLCVAPSHRVLHWSPERAATNCNAI